MRLVMLPGMDGSGALLDRFAEALPSWISPEIIRYPPSPLGYGALESRVRARLQSDEPTALLAESFSGPIAIRVAAEPPPSLRALILVATFARLPLPAMARFLITPALFLTPPPRALLRRSLLDPDSDRELVEALRSAIARIPPQVLAHRIRAALRVDVRSELEAVRLPLLILQGRRDRLLRPLDRSHRGNDRNVVTLDAPHLILEAVPLESASVVTGFLKARVDER